MHLYSVLETDIEGRCVSLQKAQWKRRHDFPDAEVARRDRASRASQATKNCRGSETAGARERRSTRDRDRRKRRLDSESAAHDAYIAKNVSSYISLLVGASLHVHVSNTCFILHAAYFILHVHVYYLVLASQEVFIAIYISCPLRSWIAPARQQCHAFS